MKSVLLFLYSCFVLTVIFPAHSCSPEQVQGDRHTQQQNVYSVKELQSDFKQFRRFLEESHPRLYQFTSKTEFDSLFEAQFQKISRPMTIQEFYPVLILLVSRVGCGHTSMWTPEGYWQIAPDQMFPLGVNAGEDKLFVIHNYKMAELVKPGSKILSVNGKEASQIVSEMAANIWSDGFIMSKRYRRLNRVFPYLYTLNYGYPEQFNMVVIEEGRERRVTLGYLSREVIEAYNDSVYINGPGGRPQLWMDLLDEQTALLNIGTFSYYDKVDKFHRFIDSSFQAIKENNIQNLIIDLRRNDGGDPFCSTHLLSYIQKKPVVYFREPYGKYARFNKPLPMAENCFSGQQYYLIDGMCFSTTGHIASLLKYHDLGVFIGEETGATYTCNDASHDIELKNTGYRLQSARKTFAAAVTGFPMDQGILPDHPVQQSIEEVIRGHDAVLDYTLKLIRRSSGPNQKLLSIN